ncbi:MAG: hypothetical protein WCF18_11195 [Chthoniobacteraceae bacterium]
MKKELIRKTWPRIRVAFVKGEKFFQVDARRKGSDGRRETFAKQKDAEDRAATIATEFAGRGSETLAMPIELRAAAMQGERILAPYDKTILQACEFYRDHLEAERKRKDSETIDTLTDAWYADKTSGNEKDPISSARARSSPRPP